MTNLEHYFENLLYHGEDIKSEANKNALTEEQQKSVEQCAQYVIYSLFGTREHFDEWIKRDAAPRWHRVEEELPKYGQDVLAARLYGADADGWAYEVIIAHVCEARVTDYWNATNITHWMPLPEPPKEEEE